MGLGCSSNSLHKQHLRCSFGLQDLLQRRSTALTPYGYAVCFSSTILTSRMCAVCCMPMASKMFQWINATTSFSRLQPPDSDPDRKDSVKWRMLSPSERSGGVAILIPASHWHFEVTDDTTIIVDGIRLPKFSSYLHGE